ncbi:MAG: class I SAM-dependent RNA methyltransferase [Treponema sp.]|jgi:putative N6-adenine-specific DNA methylase|nr:class I SAM-dependent RNA methyltransferase [Treponema sp.]
MERLCYTEAVDHLETAIALCAVGAEKIVSRELRKLDLSVESSEFGRVRFRADVAGLYRALMALRAADRVLLETGSFPAGDFDALFEGVRAVPWEQYVPPGMGFIVSKVRASRSRLRAETSIQAVAHKAAAERLCTARHIPRLPEDGSAAEVRVYIEKDQVSLLLDLAGEPLFKRGYRSEGGIAPIRETTAAAMILLANWRRKFPLYDPFCGSGTILIEAAMYAWDMAPCLGRSFALEKLSIANQELERAVRNGLLEKVNFDRIIRIAGSDEDGRAVSIARSNAERAWDLARGQSPARGIRQTIRLPEDPAWQSLPDIRAIRMKDVRAPWDEPGFIITNPPYGKRLGAPDIAEKTYGEMAELRRHFPEWTLALITDHPGFESFFGRKADSCREITNGAIPSYFFLYGEH